MKVYNYMEGAVDAVLEELLQNYNGICKCERCINDMKAIALNRLKPCYISTEKGKLFLKAEELNSQNKVDVYKALIDAIELVKEKPHHG